MTVVLKVVEMVVVVGVYKRIVLVLLTITLAHQHPGTPRPFLSFLFGTWIRGYFETRHRPIAYLGFPDFQSSKNGIELARCSRCSIEL